MGPQTEPPMKNQEVQKSVKKGFFKKRLSVHSLSSYGFVNRDTHEQLLLKDANLTVVSVPITRLYEKFKAILEATFTHSKNLASFVFGYKTITTLLRWLQSEQIQSHSFIAAFITGYLVFGKYNKVNEQINLYLLSRILYGLAKLAVKRGYIPEPQFSTFPWFAAIVWGIVLWLFEYERDTLQGSLRSSMTYLYDDSNIWHDITDFLIYNKPPTKK